MNKAADLIRAIANVGDIKMQVCIVNSVADRTCDATPLAGDAQLKDVRLNANINSSGGGIIIKPVVGSHVLVCQLSIVDSFVAMYSEIDSISIDGGENGGLVKVDELVKWMQKVHADLVTLQSSLASHVVAGNGAPLALVFNPSTEAPIPSQLQNDKIKH